MNKKEIAEIKKLFTPSHCAITRICGCYVDAEKNIKTKLKEAFLSLEEEEMFKYFKIFKSTLSGTIGKNLLNMEFPLSQESEGGTQEFLLKLRNSELKDEALIDEFYEKVMADYLYPENYYIILIHGAYDVPGRASDNLDMDDASDYVYEFILCSICPVKLSKAGLHYNAETNNIEDRIRDWRAGLGGRRTGKRFSLPGLHRPQHGYPQSAVFHEKRRDGSAGLSRPLPGLSGAAFREISERNVSVYYRRNSRFRL